MKFPILLMLAAIGAVSLIIWGIYGLSYLLSYLVTI